MVWTLFQLVRFQRTTIKIMFKNSQNTESVVKEKSKVNKIRRLTSSEILSFQNQRPKKMKMLALVKHFAKENKKKFRSSLPSKCPSLLRNGFLDLKKEN